MGNCHKNRICEFFNNHCCPQLLLDCFQSIFPNNNHSVENDDEDEPEEDDDDDENDKDQNDNDGKQMKQNKLLKNHQKQDQYNRPETEQRYNYNYQNQTKLIPDHQHQGCNKKNLKKNQQNNNNKSSLPGRLLQQNQQQNLDNHTQRHQTQANIKRTKYNHKNYEEEEEKEDSHDLTVQKSNINSNAEIVRLSDASDRITIQNSSKKTILNPPKNLQINHQRLSRQQSSQSQPGGTVCSSPIGPGGALTWGYSSFSGPLCDDCSSVVTEASLVANISGRPNSPKQKTSYHQFSPSSTSSLLTFSLLANSNNKQSFNSSSNNNQNKLKFDLQQRLEMMMQRQRSASHCPHTSLQSTGGAVIDKSLVPSMNKCCCCQKVIANANAGPTGPAGTSPTSSSNIVVDPLIKIMGVSSASSNNIGIGRQKRASSLRVLNKRFNFFDTSASNHKDKDGDGISITGSGSRRGSKKTKRQSTKMNDLDDECFLAIFEYLTLQEKLYYERVCHRWQRLIRCSLQAPASLKIGEHSVKCNCQCAHYPSWDLPPTKRYLRDKSGYIMYPKGVIKYLLTLCSQLRCINFSHCYLDDQTLQIIMEHSDMIECLHLNDIRLEEDDDDLLPNGFVDNKKHNSDGQLSNGQNSGSGQPEETISAAVGAFASEQLAVFGGLMRKLSTRRSVRKSKNRNNNSDNQTTDQAATVKRPSDASMMSTGKRSVATASSGRRGTDSSGSNTNNTVSNYNCNSLKTKERCKTPVNQTRSTPPSSTNTSSRNVSSSAGRQRLPGTPGEMSPLLPLSSSVHNRTTPNLHSSVVSSIASSSIYSSANHQGFQHFTTTTKSTKQESKISSNYLSHDDMRQSLENIVRKTVANQQQNPTTSDNNNSNKTSPKAMTPEQKRQQTAAAAAQRRREWSKHRMANKSTNPNANNNQQNMLALNHGQQTTTPLSINVINDTMNRDNSLSLCQVSFIANDEGANANSQTNQSTSLSTVRVSSANSNSTTKTAIKHLSPNVSPNLSSLQTDLDAGTVPKTATAAAGGRQSHSNSISSGSGGESQNSLLTNSLVLQPLSSGGGHDLHSDLNSSRHSSSGVHPPLPLDHGLVGGKMDHVQAYVEQEQIRHELRQTHLLQWKAFAKKLGSQIRSLSLGSLSSVDSIVIDILLKYATILEELRINNEIDILSYLSVIKPTVKRIYINCEHGIGLECVSLLAYRNYAEKVISLGRVDVPPDLIDSVISTIGSNFCNLRSLYLRLHNFDIDVATPASLLFDNLIELNLQFVAGNVDQPFKKFIQLGWSSVQSLTIQYASITEESVRAIHEHMPQLKKLVLYAIEFRCDHLARRYGHRICTNCSHTVWKSIATLPNLNHLKLHRVIIDDEICKALSRMYRLSNLELQYCSNVNDNVITVCSDLARRSPRRRFTLCIISRGFINFKQPNECNNLYIDVKVACK